MSIKDSHFSSEEGPQGITAICVHTLNDTSAIFPWRQSLEHSPCDNQALTCDEWVLAASDTPWVRREALASDPSLSSPLAGSVPTAWMILGGTRAAPAPWESKEGSGGAAFLNRSSQHFLNHTNSPCSGYSFSTSLTKGACDPCPQDMPATGSLAVNLFWSRVKWIRAAGCDTERQSEHHWSQGLPALWQSIPGPR